MGRLTGKALGPSGIDGLRPGDQLLDQVSGLVFTVVSTGPQGPQAVHLTTITDGRYELVHRATEDDDDED